MPVKRRKNVNMNGSPANGVFVRVNAEPDCKREKSSVDRMSMIPLRKWRSQNVMLLKNTKRNKIVPVPMFVLVIGSLDRSVR